MAMKIHKWADVEKGRFTPEDLAASDRRVEAELIELNLTQLRTELGKSQAEVAAAAEMTQGEISRAERRNDHLVSSLRRIVTALGGELRLTAVFADREIKLDGV